VLSRAAARLCRWDVLGGNVLVAGADEGAALQAGPGDWLLLKGHLALGNYGGCSGWVGQVLLGLASSVCVVAG
jgi:hypothetical protein